jgi:hypothetical protein
LINEEIMIRVMLPILFFCTILIPIVVSPIQGEELRQYDVVIVGGTPGGIMAAVAVARGGHTAVLLERTAHIGGLPANGLGATDIGTRGATGGLFLEFVQRIHRYYVETYGPNSRQVKDCSDGYHFEPRIAEMIFETMLAEHASKVTVFKLRQFDALPEHVHLENGKLTQITIFNRETNKPERYAGTVFIDATYEGDLAAAAGVPYRLGREGQDEYGEPMAGRLYKPWREPPGDGSTGFGDNAVQAYNYRLCLTRDPNNQAPIPKPERYNRDEFVSLIDDVKLNRTTGKYGSEMAFEGIGKLVNMVLLPNGKTDANNQHLAFLSTDLPEENWPWPTSGWDWRDRYAERLREYTLGLLWFAQHDSALPEDFRQRCLEWGLAKDEYGDNQNFPRQVYVREGRRIEGEHLFIAHDALPMKENSRPPIYADSITASHYSLDSHAVRKREPDRVHLDGFFSYPTKPYTVPYGVIVPKKVDGLLTPVPVSGTHIGFSTLRMEPCWMAMGQAAGVAACISIEDKATPRNVNLFKLQRELLKQQATLVYFQDAQPGEPHYEALQFFALRGYYSSNDWQAKLNQPVSSALARQWLGWTGAQQTIHYQAGKTTHGELLDALYEYVQQQPEERIQEIQGES